VPEGLEALASFSTAFLDATVRSYLA
jgi:hypothetical protein